MQNNRKKRVSLNNLSSGRFRKINIYFFHLLPYLLVLCVLVVVSEVYQVDLLQLELIKLSLQGNYRIFTLQRVTKNNFIEVDNFDQTAAKLFRY